MRNPREVFHEAVRRQEQFTTGCEVYFRNYATGPKRASCPVPIRRGITDNIKHKRKGEDGVFTVKEIAPSQQDVTPPPPVSDVLGRLTTTLHQLSAVTGLSRNVELPRYDGSYEAQSFFTNYDAQADRAQLQYSTRLRKPPNLLQAPLRVTNTRAGDEYKEPIHNSGDEGNEISSYLERFESYCIANDIVKIVKKKATFFSLCGRETYNIIRTLTSPKNPLETEWEEIVAGIKKYFDPTPNIIVQRFKFAKRLQMPNETISEFITALKKIAEKCEFPVVEDRLRDALVCGILNEEIQSMLLMNSMLTFRVAQEMALAHEAAVRNVAEIKDGKPQEEINVMGRAVKVRRRNEKIFKCFRCGYTNHREEQCFFKEKRCFKCQKLGHISRVCKNGNWRSDRNNNCSIDEEAEATNGLFNINQVKDTSNMRNYMVIVRTSGRVMNMLIDSGTRKNIISEKTYIRTWVKSERPRIEKDSTKLVQWNRQRLSILGKIKADVKVNKRSITMEFLVIEGPGPNLIGREAFDQIGIGLEWMNYGDSVYQINEVMNGNGMAAAMNGNGNGMAAAMNGNGNGMAAYMNGNGMAALMNGNGGKYANGMMSGANGMGAGYMNGGEDMYSEGDGLSVYGNPGVDFHFSPRCPETSFQCGQQELPGYYADQEGPTKAGGNTWAK
ncbi:K02A2.6-like [Cordylochernes scorpioides]|uniref:K02A2.6-like n=1 Tax=Cordylochernes scorpioides TaxID=51811 RepID=A0ABY6KN35_9ARAC|nr:K02A2.6-like [Cordylochernes scorpioides]